MDSSRYCNFCGHLVLQMSINRPQRCSAKDCQKRIPITTGISFDGFERCLDCYSINFSQYKYCEICGAHKLDDEAFKAIFGEEMPDVSEEKADIPSEWNPKQKQHHPLERNAVEQHKKRTKKHAAEKLKEATVNLNKVNTDLEQKETVSSKRYNTRARIVRAPWN